jgi:hypothetical protein
MMAEFHLSVCEKMAVPSTVSKRKIDTLSSTAPLETDKSKEPDPKKHKVDPKIESTSPETDQSKEPDTKNHKVESEADKKNEQASTSIFLVWNTDQGHADRAYDTYEEAKSYMLGSLVEWGHDIQDLGKFLPSQFPLGAHTFFLFSDRKFVCSLRRKGR